MALMLIPLQILWSPYPTTIVSSLKVCCIKCKIPPQLYQEIVLHVFPCPCIFIDAKAIIASVFGPFQQLVCKVPQKVELLSMYVHKFLCLLCTSLHENHQVNLCMQVFTKKNNDVGWDFVEDDDDQNMVIVGVEPSS
jgi:hypothetical protein